MRMDDMKDEVEANAVSNEHVLLTPDYDAVEAWVEDTGPASFSGVPALTDLAGYHMVFAVTQATINAQFEQLWRSDVMARGSEGTAVKLQQLRITIDDPPVKLEAELLAPKVQLRGTTTLEPGGSTGNAPYFTLRIKAGTVTRERIVKKAIVAEEEKIKDWELTFKVGLNVHDVAREILKDPTRKLPETLRKIVNEDVTEQFRVRQILMNFQDSTISTFVPHMSKMPMPGNAAPSPGMLDTIMRTFESYFLGLSKSENPYVLGYTVDMAPRVERKPAIFEPTAVAFSVYEDTAHAERSTLNFLLMTQKAELPAGNPLAGVFASNWVTSNSFDARMVLAARQFDRQYIEGYILSALQKKIEVGDTKFAQVDSFDAWVQEQVLPRHAGVGLIPGLQGKLFPTKPASSKGWGLVFDSSNNAENDGMGALLEQRTVLYNIYLANYSRTACFVGYRPAGADAIELQVRGFRFQQIVTAGKPVTGWTWHTTAWVIVPFGLTIKLQAANAATLSVTVTNEALAADSGSARATGHAVMAVVDIAVSVLTGNVAGLLVLLNEVKRAAVVKEQMEKFNAAAAALKTALEKDLLASLTAISQKVVVPGSDFLMYKNLTRDGEGNVLFDVTYDTSDTTAT